MLTAVATLAAVVVGGLLTYFAQGRLDERRAERERERDREAFGRQQTREQAALEREQARETALAEAEKRVVLRLLLEELDTIAMHYKMFADAGHYPKPLGPEQRAFAFPTEVWETNKRALARFLSDDTWGLLATIMHSVTRAREIVLGGSPLQPIEPTILAQLRDGVELTHELYVLLAGKPPPSIE
jgi:hypothetical protein